MVISAEKHYFCDDLSGSTFEYENEPRMWKPSILTYFCAGLPPNSFVPKFSIPALVLFIISMPPPSPPRLNSCKNSFNS